MRTRFIALLRILVILSLSCGGPVPRFSVPPVTIPFDREQGFYLLGAYWVDAQDTISFHGQTVDLDGLKVPRAASGPSEFVAAWRKLLFPYPPPSVDFATHVVIFFGAYENLRCGVRPTTALLLTQHADLMPRSPGNYLCERRNVWRYGWHLLPPPDTGIAIRAVAVARAALPRDGVFVGNHGLAFKAPPAAMPPAARAKVQFSVRRAWRGDLRIAPQSRSLRVQSRTGRSATPSCHLAGCGYVRGNAPTARNDRRGRNPRIQTERLEATPRAWRRTPAPRRQPCRRVRTAFRTPQLARTSLPLSDREDVPSNDPGGVSRALLCRSTPRMRR